jgi:hypothetical protein
MRKEMLKIHCDLTYLGFSLKKQITKLQELVITNMQPHGKMLSPNRSKRQRKLRGGSKGGSSSSSMDTRWADKYDTDVDKPYGGNDTIMEVSPTGDDVY